MLWPGCFYYGCVENFVPNGVGIYSRGKKVRVGVFQNSKLEGMGAIFENDWLVYIGEFFRGLYQGQGQYHKKNMLIYKGNFY